MKWEMESQVISSDFVPGNICEILRSAIYAVSLKENALQKMKEASFYWPMDNRRGFCSKIKEYSCQSSVFCLSSHTWKVKGK